MFSRLSTLVFLVLSIGAGTLLAGCGGGHHESTTDVQGIVLTYPETLTGTVTEADLTPAGAGIRIGVQALYDLGYDTPPYYKKHDYPQTDASGHFILKHDARLQESVYATNLCSDTPAVGYAGDDGPAVGYYTGSDAPIHDSTDQLIKAGILGDSIKAKYNVASVIVVSRRTGACQILNIPVK